MSKNLETMEKYSSDMLSVVRHVHDAVDRQKTDQKVLSMPEAHELLQKISQTLDGQVAILRRHQVEMNAEESSSWKETIASTLGQAAGFIGMVRPDKVSLMLRDDYTALNMTAIAYTMLHTTALALSYDETASLAENHLRQITPLIIEINELIPKVVARELTDEVEHIDMSLIPQAIQNTQAAWDSDHVHAGHAHDWAQSRSDEEMGGEYPVV